MVPEPLSFPSSLLAQWLHFLPPPGPEAFSSSSVHAGARSALLEANKKHIKVVVGNEAADADTIVSSICLAHYLHATRSSEDSAAGVQYVPVLPLPRAELKFRPETLLLFRLANLKETTVSDMVFIDEVDLTEAAAEGKLAGVILTDHNKITEPLQGLGELIEGIVDHHEDQGLYEWITDSKRDIAFSSEPPDLDSNHKHNNRDHNNSCSSIDSENDLSISRSLSTNSVTVGRALVASTCTLVAERYLGHPSSSSSSSSFSPYSSSSSLLTTPVALLLLGVILLDSVSLDERAGKVTPRDEKAARALMEIVAGREGGIGGGKEALYKQLSGAKFDREWWRSLEVEEVLGLDYKSFKACTQSCISLRYGMSSILLPLEDFLKEGLSVESALETFATSRGIELLVLMFLVMPEEGKEGGEVLRRALAIYASHPSFGSRLAELLLSSGTEAEGLALEPVEVEVGGIDGGRGGERRLWCFRQGNTQASRKQVGPIFKRILEEGGEELLSK
ncbi:inorganic pyrophosphatase exopolyphosphatase [Nannochloropsis oceanica]